MSEKRKPGHQVEFTKKRIAELVEKMEAYTEEATLPTVAEFCYLNGIHKQRLSDIPGLADAKKRTIKLKQEYQTLKATASMKIPAALGIFMLKNNGWSDKQEIKHMTENENGEEVGILDRLNKLYDEAGKDSSL